MKTISRLGPGIAIWLAAACGAAIAQEDPGQPPEELVASRQARDALVDASDFEAALGPAERSAELSADRPDLGHHFDLLQLAHVQAEVGLHEDAEENYLAAIAELEQREGQDAIVLIGPYQALGRTYINTRRFTEAATVLQHAQDISKRHSGLFNVEQSALIDDMTMAYLGLGDTGKARELQLSRLENAVRTYGESDPRLVPFYMHLGEYYDNSRLRLSAREQYEQALAIQDEQPDVDLPTQLHSLRKLVELELLLGDADEARLRLVRTLEETADELGPVDRGLSLALLGDAAILAEDFENAASYYREAYAALASANPLQAEEFFSRPSMIDFMPPLSDVDRGRRSRPYAWASIVLRFDVTAEGRATNVETVSLEPNSDADEDYDRRIRETHFRPRLEDGRPVATADVEFSHFFRYYVRRQRRR